MAGRAGNLHRFDQYFYPYNNGRGGDSFYTSNPGGESLGAYNFKQSNVWHLFMAMSSTGINGQSVGYIWRFYADSFVDHLFKFGSGVPSSAYVREGAVGVAFRQNGPYRQPIYRFYAPSTGDHMYSTASGPTPSGYIYEGIAWYSPIRVYGCKDPNATNYNGWANQPSTGCNYTVYGCTDPNATNYNPSANVNSGCTYPTPSVSLSISPSSIIRGQSATISWSAFNSTSQNITGLGNVSGSGSQTISPTSTTSYRLTGNYYGYTNASVSRTLTVYQPPNIQFTADDSEIVSGVSTTLRWNVSGSVNSVTIDNGVGSTNLSSLQTISPTVTTTYTLSASGPGGTGSATVTVVVVDPPEVAINGPLSVNYGDNVIISHEMTKAITTYELQIMETDLDNNITAPPESPVNLGPGQSADSTYTHYVTYHDRGPRTITYILYGVGQAGLTAIDQLIVPINIDQTPDAIDIPSSEDKLRDQLPVISPDAEVTSEQILIDDIDIPVVIKASQPIQVEIENSGIYLPVEEM
jgi:hypothetical protein